MIEKYFRIRKFNHMFILIYNKYQFLLKKGMNLLNNVEGEKLLPLLLIYLILGVLSILISPNSSYL